MHDKKTDLKDWINETKEDDLRRFNFLKEKNKKEKNT